MHMADALLSHAVGGAMLGATGLVGWHCCRVLSRHPDPARVPLMGVLAAFVFAAQMVNFAIPGTGSSGHLGGGLLLAILLGPEAAFLVIGSVLVVQALLFADGGLLALGCNVFNLGVFPAFVAYPWVYRPLATPRPGASPAQSPGPLRLTLAAVAAALVGLGLGSLAVVLQTSLSGVTALPFGPFAALMLPIHLAIAVVEGLATAAVLLYVRRLQPELLVRGAGTRPGAGVVRRRLLGGLALAAVLSAALLTWVASDHPDGLEWSIRRVAPAGLGSGAPRTAGGWSQALTALQPKDVAPLLAGPGEAPGRSGISRQVGTSLAGLLGTGATLALAAGLGLLLRRRRNQGAAARP